MAAQRTPDSWGLVGDPPSDVRVRFVPGPGGPILRDRITGAGMRRSRRAVLVVAVALALGGAAAVGALAIGNGGAARGTLPVRADATESAGVAAAYRYPVSCLNVVVAPSDPTYARAWLYRASPCWRYGAYVTAVFHRVGGLWRPVLDSAVYRCPAISIPAAVQVELSVCPNTNGVTPLWRFGERVPSYSSAP